MVPIWVAGDDVQLKSKFAMFQVGPRPTKTTMTRPRSFEDDIDFPYLRSSTGFGDMKQRAADVCSPRRAYAGRVKARRADRLGALDRFPEHDRIRAHTDARQPASRFATRGVVDGFLGPTFGLATDAVVAGSIPLRGASAALGGQPADVTPSDVATLRRLAPFASLPYWRWLIDGGFGFDYGAVPALKEAVR